ncbi:ly6/PLAUR domain-containing protein 6 isoform X2 [Anabrus simplex]|uniref:ly6/PLAUR domain-containing protein 6 isoform X2 n=1 Tax=Anabrus simplex TaxID=316456 RepID=UPI0034DD3106
MLSVQCGWVLSCLVVALLHQRAQPAATTSSPNNEPPLPPPPQQQQQQKTTDHTGKPDAETEAGVTCYTCVNVSDNLVCNRFAIDRPCPQGEEFCHTLHIMDSHGESVIVNKKCADQYECSPQRVGCLDIDSQKIK